EASVLLGPKDENGIGISAGNGDVVSLRGLVIDGQGTGPAGISIASASAVHIQNCVIRNFESASFGWGLWWIGIGQLFVSDTIVFNNGSGPQSGGIFIGPVAIGVINAVLDRIHLENNVRGLWVDGTGDLFEGPHVVIRDSVVSGNAADGIIVTTTP